MLMKRKIGELRVSELRAELEKRNLDSKGLKGTLLQRLQKAIIEEGGDVNQIEVDVVSSPSQSRKNSPRVKKPADTLGLSDNITKDAKISELVETDVTIDPSVDQVPLESLLQTPKDVKQIADDPSIFSQEKQDESSLKDEERSFPEDTSANIDMSSYGKKEQIDQKTEGSFSKRDSDLLKEDHFDAAEHIDKECVHYNDNTTSDPKQAAEDEELDMFGGQTNKLDENEFVELAETSDIPDDLDYEHDEKESDAAITYSNAEAVSADNPQFSETGLCDENKADPLNALENDNDAKAMEAGDGGADEKDSDIAMEDDVLDMLDYDIEIPEQISQVPDTTDEVGKDLKNGESSNEGDVKAKVTHMSDENNKKDSSDRTERFDKSKATSDDAKLSKNLWISGLSASTRASELKVAFSRYGKVVGAKVVTNARSPGSKCYGFVAMASVTAADKCILHLNKTEMHGRVITVEHTKNDPSASKKTSKRSNDDEEASVVQKPSLSLAAIDASRRNASEAAKDSKLQDEVQSDLRIGEKRARRSDSDDKLRGSVRTLSSRRDSKSDRPPSNEPKRENSSEPFRKRLRPTENRERKVVIDNKKGEMSLRVKVRSPQDGRRPNVMRRVSHSPVRGGRAPRIEERPARKFESRHDAFADAHRRGEARRRDAREDISRKRAVADSSRPTRPMAVTASIERDRMLLRKEREERNFLRQEREKLERERRQLERDRLERERLEQERVRLELERKRELEKIEREKREMKRLQEINRYELNQRQRQIKRMYNDDRAEAKHIDRDDRRRYDGDSRDRGGASMSTMYRDEEGGYRSRSGASSRMESSRLEKTNFHDIDRRNIAHNDTDARYGHSSAGSGRRVEKYDRATLKHSPDYHERRSGADSGRGSMSYRHHDKDSNDDRKVVSRERGRPSSSMYHRDDIKKEVSVQGSSSSMSWKEGKSTAGSSRGRPSDRDLREEIRQGSSHGSGGSRKPSDPGRGDLRHRDDAPSSRRDSPRNPADKMDYDRKQPDSSMHHSLPPAPASGNPIPTTGRSGINNFPSTTWPAWQDRQENGSMWHGAGGPPIAGNAPVGRILAQPIGVPFNAINPMNPPMQISGDMGAHSMPANYIPADQRSSQRTDSFKPLRRF